MKKRKTAGMILVMFCLMFAGILTSSETAYAKRITNYSQVKKMALKKVKGAHILEIDKDYEKGVLIWEVDLIKGTKKYEIKYRASDGKMLSYEWEQKKIDRKTKKKVISQDKCKSLARKQVKGAKITSINKKYEKGIVLYKVKMKTSTKKYELKYHGRTGKLIKYEEELIIKPQKQTSYIGVKKAKEIALKKVPGATVVKVEFDRDDDDGVPVYEVELIKGQFEYEIEIHARTGKILDFDKDYRDDYEEDDDYYDDYY